LQTGSAVPRGNDDNTASHSTRDCATRHYY
jgi:hypothetical protein